jgi:hypothetical protein
MSGVDPYEGTITHRDPLTKTMVESFAAQYPDLSDVELCERILQAARGLGGDLSSDVMSPEIVAYWRAKAAAR